MKKICETLAESPLFAGLGSEQFGEFCAKVTLRVLWKGEILVNEGDECLQLGIVASGQLAMQKYSGNGDFVTIGLLGPGDAFGEDFLFGSNHIYRASLEAVTNSKVITLPKMVVTSLLETHPFLTKNFIRFLSDRVQMERRRIAILSQRSLRQKISAYLLDLLHEQGDAEDQPGALRYGKPGQRMLTPSVELPSSKEVASNLLAMPRPSFSRELVRMEQEGLIRLNGRIIWLTNLDGLEQGIGEAETEDWE